MNEKLDQTANGKVGEFADLIGEFEQRRDWALGADLVSAEFDAATMTARQRVSYLVDENSFLETGLFAVAPRPEVQHKAPADGKITGFAKIDGRPVSLVSNDFRVMGASSSPVNSKKMRHMKEAAAARGLPLVLLGESTGARMPDVMGAASVAASSDSNQYRRLRETPWVSAILGPSYGSAAWYAALSDFVVMREDVTLGVSSAKLTSMAISEALEPDLLGGSRIHAEQSGIVDMVVKTDADALDAIKRFLSYLPSHNNEAPPRVAVPAGSDVRCKDILELLPSDRKRAYDVRKLMAAIVDRDSIFELKEKFGRSIVTSLARLDGKSVGIVANNPKFKGGAIDPDACQKVTGFLVLCDSFNIPIVFLADQPGFLIGSSGEARGAVGKVMNWMNALSLCTVPRLLIILRKSYGQAVLNMGAGGNSDQIATWFTSEISFMDPTYGAEIVFGRKIENGELSMDDAIREMQKTTSAYDMASNYSSHMVLDPRETRNYLKSSLEYYELRKTTGVGDHLMCSWPTSM